MSVRTRLGASLLALLLVGAACSSPSPALPDVGESQAPVSPQAPSPVPTGKGSAAAAMARLCERPPVLPPTDVVQEGPIPAAIAEVQGQVEQVRGLEFIDRVPVDALTHEELVGRLTGFFDHSYPDDLFARRSLAWETIGAIPRGTSIQDALRSFFTGQVIGFYVPTSGELVFIGSDHPTPLERITLAHELTHAIDDQHFRLERIDVLENRCRDESLAAAVAAVEGSAQFFSIQFGRQFLTADEQLSLIGGGAPPIEDVPPFIFQTQIWPYTAGLQFIASLELRGGLDAVNEAIETFPTSTEQIIHPERYPNDVPQPVDVSDLAPALGEGWANLDVQEVGEEWLAILLGLRLAAEEAGAAAAGWDGGIYRAWSNGHRVAVVLATVWDTAGDAEEFADAIARWLEAGGQRGAVFQGGTRVEVGFASDAEALAALGVTP